MHRFIFALGGALLSLGLSSHSASAKCGDVDSRRVTFERRIVPKTVPKGVEIYDRVWLINPTSTELITYTPEKGAAVRTGYREKLGAVPTTKDELPGMKLVNGEHYEYHYPANPTYPDGRTAVQGGWVKQDYAAGLALPKPPKLPDGIEDRIFNGKLPTLPIKVSVPIYFGKKRSTIDFVYEFAKNPNYGVADTKNCPSPSPTP